MHINRDMVELVLTIVTGIGVVLQAAVLFGILLAVRESQKKIHSLTERVEEVTYPLINTTRGLIEDLSPKLKQITGNLVQASETLRKQSENVSSVVNDVTERTRQQTARVDGIITQQTARVNSIVSGALNSIGEASAAVERGIAAPLRQVNGVLAGLKAGLDKLRTGPEVATRRPAPAAPVYATPAPSHVAPPVVVPSSVVPPVVVSTSEPDDYTPEQAREAAARFVRDRAAAERR